MSNTRDNGDADSAVPIGLEVTEQTVPLTEDSTWEAMSDKATHEQKSDSGTDRTETM